MVGLDLMELGGHAESKTALWPSTVEIQELSLECDMIDYSLPICYSLHLFSPYHQSTSSPLSFLQLPVSVYSTFQLFSSAYSWPLQGRKNFPCIFLGSVAGPEN